MVKVSFNSALAQKDLPKEENTSEVLIIPETKEQCMPFASFMSKLHLDLDDANGTVQLNTAPEEVVFLGNILKTGNLSKATPYYPSKLTFLKEPDEAVPIGQRRAWCWCMCIGLALMLAGVVLGGAYLYKYFAMQRGVYFCGLKYIEDDMTLTKPYADSPAARYHSIEENIQILEEEGMEFISVPVPEFANSDPADIVHDFHRKLTAYLDLALNKCYVIPLNTSIVMPPKNFLELLVNIKAGTYLPQSYLIHEQMVVTDRIENVDQLGIFIERLCRDKETYKLQRRDTIRGIHKRAAANCHKIRHFENTFAVETEICDQ